jgi:hypothetical protein
MRFKRAWIGLLCAAALAADKKLPIEKTSNELVEITASALIDRDQIRQELGSDLGGSIIVVRVKVRPVSDKPVKIDRDDFLLLSDRDGQRSQPYAPSQIAGSSTLVVTPNGAARGGMLGNSGGPIWGGIPGVGGRPRRTGGDGGSAGNTAEPASNESKVEATDSDKESPLLAVLKEKVLPEKEITEPAAGLLYFQMEGKLKPKDLELHYKTPAGPLKLRFRP